MTTRLLIVLFCLSQMVLQTGTSHLVLSQEKEPPYSKPPILEKLFSDRFAKDSRADFKVGGKENSVRWRKGELGLGDGAILQRKIDAGSWIELTIAAEFPGLKKDGQSTELRIWLDFNDATDAYVRFKQKRDQGKTRASISVVDTNGRWNQKNVSKMESPPLTIEGPLNVGWTISYREGLWVIRDSESTNQYFAYTEKLSSPIKQLITNTTGDHRLRAVRLSGAKNIRFAPDAKVAAKLNEANGLSQQAVQHFYSGQANKAVTKLVEVKNIRRELLGQYHPMYAASLINLAAIYRAMGAFEKAEPLFIQARDLYQVLLGIDHPDYATCLNNLAGLYQMMGAYEKAELQFVHARDIREKVLGRKHAKYALSVNNLATLYQMMGAYEKAEPLCIQARDIWGKILGKKHLRYATSLNNLAELYRSTGAYEKAEPLYLQASEICEQSVGKNHPEFALIQNNLGLLYDAMGMYEKAEPLLMQALDSRGKIVGKEHPDYALILNNLGAHYEATKSFEKAERFYLQARDIREKALGDDHPKFASSLNNLAVFYHSLGNYKKAEPLYIQSQAIQEKMLGKTHPEYALSLNNLAGLYHSTGEYDKAEQLYIRARDIQEKVHGKDLPNYVSNLDNLGSLYQLVGRNKEADRFLLDSLQITRAKLEQYSSIQNQHQQREFAKSIEYRFSAFVTNSLGMEDRVQTVWDQSIQWKGMMLVRQKRNLLLANQPETRDLFGELKDIRSQLFRHLQADPSAKDWKKRKQLLIGRENAARQKLSKLIRDLNLDLVNQSELQIHVPAGSCLIDFRKFTHRVFYKSSPNLTLSTPHYLALIRKPDGTVKMLDLGSASVIERAILSWRGPIENANASERTPNFANQDAMAKAGRKLRRLLWEPLEKHIGDSQFVIVSPDGALGRLPLIALPGGKPGTYLLEERKIVHLPVPALLPQLLSKPSTLIKRSSSALLVGGINYGEVTKETTPDLATYRNRRILRQLRFGPLPNSVKEIHGIQSLFASPVLLTKENASETSFQSQLKEKQVVHIATHGFFQSPDRFMKNLPRDDQESLVMLQEQAKVLTENPNLLSGLALTDANTASGKKVDEGDNDGILYSAEIAMIPMEHVELAVLSACETSLGTDDNPGEGLIGLQRAFQVAGAKSVVASYWKVDDRATQLLMNKFYENLFEYAKKVQPDDVKNGRTTIRLDALRDAQLWMLNHPVVASATNRGEPIEVDPKKIRKAEANTKPSVDSSRTHPRYWAAFMLSGDWR